VGTVGCTLLKGRAVWLTMIPLGFIFVKFLYADLVTEKDMLNRIPSGH